MKKFAFLSKNKDKIDLYQQKPKKWKEKKKKRKKKKVTIYVISRFFD